jgi:hypothetical protein
MLATVMARADVVGVKYGMASSQGLTAPLLYTKQALGSYSQP